MPRVAHDRGVKQPECQSRLARKESFTERASLVANLCLSSEFGLLGLIPDVLAYAAVPFPVRPAGNTSSRVSVRTSLATQVSHKT